jgi:hypothetical protein
MFCETNSNFVQRAESDLRKRHLPVGFIVPAQPVDASALPDEPLLIRPHDGAIMPAAGSHTRT